MSCSAKAHSTPFQIEAHPDMYEPDFPACALPTGAIRCQTLTPIKNRPVRAQPQLAKVHSSQKEPHHPTECQYRELMEQLFELRMALAQFNIPPVHDEEDLVIEIDTDSFRLGPEYALCPDAMDGPSYLNKTDFQLSDITVEFIPQDTQHVRHSRQEFLLNGPKAPEEDSSKTKDVSLRLTDRQRQIVTHLLEGLCNKGIAKKLGISPATVKAHLRSIFTLLGVENRKTLMAKFRHAT